MKWGRLTHTLLWMLAVLSVLAVFLVLDWYPTVRDLGRLRRVRGDLERKIRGYRSAAETFEFPDAEERSLFAQNDTRILQSLPQVETDDAWLGLAYSDLLARAKGFANQIMVFSEAEAFGPGPPGLTGWLRLQAQEIRQRLQAADPRQRYPWRGGFLIDPTLEGHLASRPLGVALDAPLTELLDFINHISWSDSRLEIVHLRLEPVGWIVRAFLVCRGDYYCLRPSAWAVMPEPGNGNGLTVDPDSPLLGQKVNTGVSCGDEKKELPPLARR
jgi:hypothetical protein